MNRKLAIAVVSVAAMWSVSLLPAYGNDRTTLPGNHPLEAEKLAVTGNADPNLQLTMQVRFALRNRAKLEKLLEDQQNPSSPRYRKWLKTGEFAERFGARPADVAAVTAWLRGEEFTIVAANRTFVEFKGSAAQATHTFATNIMNFGAGGVYANVNDPTIPS